MRPTAVLGAILALSPAALAQDVLTLNPKPGVTLNYVSTVESRTELVDVRLEPTPGRAVSAQTRQSFEQARAQLRQQLGSAGIQRVNVTQSLRVLPRLNDGSVVVRYTQSLPLPDGTTQRLVFRQITAPGGKTRLVLDEVSGDPGLRAVLEKVLQSQQTQDFASQGIQNLYGQPLTVGRARTQRLKLDFAQLLGSLSGLLPQGARLGVAGTLTLDNTTTYRGRGAGGNFTFDVATRLAQPGTVRYTVDGQSFELGMRRLNVTGRSAYRPDGLQAGTNATTEQELRLTLPFEEGARLALTLRVTQKVNATVR
ncbi:hypothetical protein [Deinococcus planocerae]|uniref:hypothetical protein n=1 Tax=Deinococcus planocerae TaxID=1737569 RepID=UPI000C7EFFAB|nr:hypothetical protein [Deinococcus planocerae]